MLQSIIFAATVTLVFNWSAPPAGPAPTSYKLYSGDSPGVYNNSVDVGNKLTLTRTENITTVKYYAVAAVNAIGEGPKSAEVVAGFPQQPTNLTVSAQ